jgi:hypothetical protein
MSEEAYRSHIPSYTRNVEDGVPEYLREHLNPTREELYDRHHEVQRGSLESDLASSSRGRRGMDELARIVLDDKKDVVRLARFLFQDWLLIEMLPEHLYINHP